MHSVIEKAKSIRIVIFDVDGVLTDGTLYFTDSGEEIKAFNSRDGHGMKMLKASGVELAIITARESRSVKLRAENLNITLLYQGEKNKLKVFESLVTKLKLDMSSCAYVGDDLIDLPVMTRCGLSICVPSSPILVKKHAHYVTNSEGGQGAVREVCEMIMRSQGTLDEQLEKYLI
ncbi:MAG: 3-deoxy-manno-octulosonate-8-phosphatase KdsC [Burkholderiales bacterium]|jgi:3-deoxy-D-manno-octulosonate 8-phosphate phosphatase (KDO 8-P phosphatase)|tara:strand:- start:86 stop:610 length:525 start_codon:yes stop_codon:yes gene_type:complete